MNLLTFLLFPVAIVRGACRLAVRIVLEVSIIVLDYRASRNVGRAYWHGAREEACHDRADRLGRRSDQLGEKLEEWI